MRQPRIETQQVECVDLEPRRTYPLRYARALLPHLIGRRPLRLEDRGVSVETEFQLTERQSRQWRTLFGWDAASARATPAAPPFTYHSAADTFSLFALARRLGVPFRHVLHAFTHVERTACMAPGHVYTARSVYERAEPRRNHGALLHFATTVKDQEGRSIVSARNGIFVRRIRPERWNMLTPTPAPLRLRRPRPLLGAPLWSISIRLDPALSRGFGRVSGDLNPLHTVPWLARRLGHRTGFLQGMCAFNLTATQLQRRIPGSLTDLRMTFSRPFYQGERVTLNVLDGQFEWVDAQAKVLGYGAYGTGDVLRPHPTPEAARPWTARMSELASRTGRLRRDPPTIDPALGF